MSNRIYKTFLLRQHIVLPLRQLVHSEGLITELEEYVDVFWVGLEIDEILLIYFFPNLMVISI